MDGVYQRVDYLIEYAQWLKVNDFSLDDTLDILDWASDLLLNMKKTAESRPGLYPPSVTVSSVSPNQDPTVSSTNDMAELDLVVAVSS